MWAFLLMAFLQSYFSRPILEAEDARLDPPTPLLEALQSPDTHVQRLAARAIGRLERVQLAEAVRPLLTSPDAGVRMEAVNALGQMNAPVDAATLLENEKDAAVRAVLYETAGRLRDLPPGSAALLVDGLKDVQAAARTGAAKGLEAMFRTHRTMKPSADELIALRQAFRDNSDATLRELVMLTLNAAGDADPATLKLALDDPEPQVRRLAVIASKQWKDDPSYIVRYEALKIAPGCDRAASLVRDPSDHVALLAIDLLGNGCNGRIIERIIDTEKDWRKQAHAIVALAKVDPESAKKRLTKIADHEVWQARVYAVEAAKIANDDRTVSRLGRDNHPNVMAAAIVTPRDALRNLDSSHYGQVLEAAKKLKGWNEGRLGVTALLSALDRIAREKKATSRDVRTEILQRLREFGDVRLAGDLRPYLSDFDPSIAKLAADIMTEKGGAMTEPVTRMYATKPVPGDAYLRGLEGATAIVKMKEAGAFTIELIPEEAPVTVATFAQLAETEYYKGLTMHRIVPNFVLQGGSPGANEYVGYSDFMRDELGLLSHRRGTLGISTRGRDTGDAQIFINLVDNFRLDHNYTVFARVVEGMENVDKIQEGDVIESIEILRKVQP
jgi:cyclophilin family peptidyl-prolyl cis-trans isomerase/HEAT repeat protein